MIQLVKNNGVQQDNRITYITFGLPDNRGGRFGLAARCERDAQCREDDLLRRREKVTSNEANSLDWRICGGIMPDHQRHCFDLQEGLS